MERAEDYTEDYRAEDYTEDYRAEDFRAEDFRARGAQFIVDYNFP